MLRVSFLWSNLENMGNTENEVDKIRIFVTIDSVQKAYAFFSWFESKP